MLDELGWEKVVLLGAARGGAHGLIVASRFPERAAALVLVDYVPAIGIEHPRGGAAHEAGDRPRVAGVPDARDFPDVELTEIESAQDVSADAPDALAADVEAFLDKRSLQALAAAPHAHAGRSARVSEP